MTFCYVKINYLIPFSEASVVSIIVRTISVPYKILDRLIHARIITRKNSLSREIRLPQMEISRFDRYRLGQVEIPHWRVRPMKTPVKNLILTVKALFKILFHFLDRNHTFQNNNR